MRFRPRCSPNKKPANQKNILIMILYVTYYIKYTALKLRNKTNMNYWLEI